MGKREIFIIILICLLSFSGCMIRNNQVMEGEIIESGASESLFDPNSYVFCAQAAINVMEPISDGILSLVVSENGTAFFETVRNGEIIFKVELDDNYSILSYAEDTDEVYAYNRSKGQIEIKDTEFQTKRILLDNFYPYEIKEMEKIGNYLYALCVSNDPYIGDDHSIREEGDGYMDFGEEMYRIDLYSGEMTALNMKGIISFAKTSDSGIYLYVYKNESYYVDKYDLDLEHVLESWETNDAGYIFSFSVLGDYLYYIGLNTNGICSKNLINGMIESEVREAITLMQCDFDVMGDTLVYLNRNCMETNVMHPKGSESTVEKDNELVIGLTDIYTLPYSFEELEELSGFDIKTYESPIVADSSFNQKLIQKLLDGDSDIDVFILSIGEEFSGKIMEDGICYPLNTVEELYLENSSYFDVVAETMKTESGKIWGIPLSIYCPFLVAYPDNMTRSGVTEEDYEDFFQFISMLERVNSSDERYCFIMGSNYGAELLLNYMNNHKQEEYDYDLLAKYFERMWKGWMMGGNYGYENHPLMGQADPEFDKTLSACSLNMDPLKTICNMVSMKDILSIESLQEGTSVYPMPPLIKGDKNQLSVTQVAVINPKGKHLENAIEYLKLLSNNAKEKGRLGIVYKDLNSYAGMYDTRSTIFREMFEINSGSIVQKPGVINDIYRNEIIQYQQGKLSLEEVIEKLKMRFLSEKE